MQYVALDNEADDGFQSNSVIQFAGTRRGIRQDFPEPRPTESMEACYCSAISSLLMINRLDLVTPGPLLRAKQELGQIYFTDAGLPGFRRSTLVPMRFSNSSTNLLPPVSLLLLIAERINSSD